MPNVFGGTLNLTQSINQSLGAHDLRNKFEISVSYRHGHIDGKHLVGFTVFKLPALECLSKFRSSKCPIIATKYKVCYGLSFRSYGAFSVSGLCGFWIFLNIKHRTYLKLQVCLP